MRIAYCVLRIAYWVLRIGLLCVLGIDPEGFYAYSATHLKRDKADNLSSVIPRETRYHVRQIRDSKFPKNDKVANCPALSRWPVLRIGYWVLGIAYWAFMRITYCYV